MHSEVFFYAVLSVLFVSLASLIGVLVFWLNSEKLQKILIYLVSFSAGALLGDVFIHLLPELIEKVEWISWHLIGVLILWGIVVGLAIEKLIHRNHCHHVTDAEHPHPVALMNLIGDFIHNFIDGLIIGASFLISIPVGISTALAILFHEIPQEIWDFAILIYGGYKKRRALWLNFLTALSAFFWLFLVFILGDWIENLHFYLIPFAIGMFIYIAGSDLIPEMNKHNKKIRASLLQILMFLLGIGVMLILLIWH